MAIAKPHDTFFKHRFAHKTVAEDFLKARLPEKLIEALDFNTLKLQKNDFLPSDYRSERATDLLWAIQTKEGKEIDFFFHLEGQSTPQRDMALRVLEYQVAIARQFYQYHPSEAIPTIMTFVFYHGQQPWKGPKSIAAAYKDFSAQIKYALTNDFLIDFRSEKRESLATHGHASTAEMTLAAQAQNRLIDYFDDLYTQLIENKEAACCQKATLAYCLNTNQGKEQEIFKKIAKLNPETATKYRHMFEQATQQAEQRGIKLGEQRGKQEATKNIVSRLLKSGMSMQEIAQHLAMSEAELARLVNN